MAAIHQRHLLSRVGNLDLVIIVYPCLTMVNAKIHLTTLLLDLDLLPNVLKKRVMP